jgi:hypothetical protein
MQARTTQPLQTIMPWRLREDLYWCDCSGRAVFLDLKADKYFCLPQGANAAFLRAARNEAEARDSERLDPLVRRGLLAEGDGRTGIQSPAAIEEPKSDFLSDRDGRASLLDIIRAISSELRTAWWLRRRPLHEVIERARGRRPKLSFVERHEHGSIQAIVSAAEATALLLRSHDRCLVRGLALHASCRKRGLDTRLVLGFAAHCWVQLGNVVLVGGYEQARLYTPILVLE